jgi:TolB protein
MLVYGSHKLGPPYLYSHDLPSGARKAVAKYPGSNISPAVSPDGLRLAMVLSKGGNPDLYVGNLDGAGLPQLTTTKEEESSPCFSPDGRTILFTSRASGIAGLYSIPVGGGNMKRLGTAGYGTPTEADWSPDGKYIAFTMLPRGEHQICVMPIRGQPQPIVAGEDPCWAPNSRALIFTRGPDHAKKLYLLDVPTKQIKDIARISESNSQPSWARIK